jgi:hypothetical protein
MRKNLFYALVLAAVFPFVLAGCSFFSSLLDTESGGEDYESQVTGVSLSASSLSLAGDESEYLKLTVTPSSVQNKVSPKWTCDGGFAAIDGDTDGVVVTGAKTGETWIECTINKIVARCKVTVTSDSAASPSSRYISSNQSVINLTPGSTGTVSVSLFNGTAAEYEDFSWSVKNSAVASISSARNNCLVTASRCGTTQVTVHHPKSQYDYTFIIYVHPSSSSAIPYITTGSNIVSINKTVIKSKSVSFTVENPVSPLWISGFSYENSDSTVCSIAGAGSELEITPLKAGLSRITVSNSQCEYSAEIIVLVSTVVDNVYVTTDVSRVILTGSDSPATISASVNGYSGYVDPDGFTFDVAEDKSVWSSCMTLTAAGSSCRIEGKKNGAFHIRVGHPLSSVVRTVLVVLRQQAGSAIDSSMYITTTSNYVQTKCAAEGADPAVTDVTVTLVGGVSGDENDFIWSIDKGADNGICLIETTTGTVKSRSAAATSGTDAYGILHITPRSEGTVKISVGHPKCLYTTDILVKVYSCWALLADPVTLSVTDSGGNAVTVCKVLNSVTSGTVLKGVLTGAADGAANYISWSSADASRISVSPSSGETCVASPCGSGSGQTYVSARYEHGGESALSDKRVLFLTADTQDELDSMKVIYADSTYYRMNAGAEQALVLAQYGLSDTDVSLIKWSSSDGSVASVASGSAAGSSHLYATVRGISEGAAEITASLDGCASVVFNVTVLPEGEDTGVIKAKYLTTSVNAVVLSEPGKTADLSVTGVNLTGAELLSTEWDIDSSVPADSSSSSPVISVAPNGAAATVTAAQIGRASVTVSNPNTSLPDNKVRFDVKCGALYEYQDDTYIYVNTDKDTYTLVCGGSITVGAALENSTAEGGFSWSVSQGSQFVDITGSASGTCVIKGIAAGEAVIKVGNSHADFDKEIVVVVAQDAQSLADITYLTTAQNVLAMVEGASRTVSVSIANSSATILTGYSWIPENPDIVSVVSSGATAVVKALSTGSTRIKVSNGACAYPLQLIVTCSSQDDASENPYIACTNIVTLTVGGDPQTVSADLIGGTDSDDISFSWSSLSDGSVIKLSAQNNTAQITALSAGTAQIVVSHPKANGIDRTILVICEAASTVSYYITASSSVLTLAPDGEDVTVTADLVNGTDADDYDFSWSASRYDIISIAPAESTCSITPLSTGQAEVYITHPKTGSRKKTVIVNVTKYTTFAFACEYMTISNGSGQGNDDGSVFAEVDTPSVADTSGAYCLYSSSSDDVASVGLGTTSVCQIIPHKVGSTVILARLVTASSDASTGYVTELGRDTLMVYVSKAPDDTTYISLSQPSLVPSAAVGDTITVTAGIGGTNASNLKADDLEWQVYPDSSQSPSKSIISTTPSMDGAGVVKGAKTVIFKVLSEGSCSVQVSHPSLSGLKRTLYFHVPGSSAPSITLNYTSAPVYLGSTGIKLSASVTNPAAGDVDGLKWLSSDPAVAKIEGTGRTVHIAPLSVGSCRISCTLPSDASVQAFCTVSVDQQPTILFSGVPSQMCPFDEKVITYTVSPASQKVFWKVSDTSYAVVTGTDSYPLSDGWSTPDPQTGKGEIRIITTKKEGSFSLTGTTDRSVSGSVTVSNSYGYLLSTDKSILSALPCDTPAGSDVLSLQYSVRPACCRLYVGSGSLHSDGSFASGSGIGHLRMDMTGITLKADSQNVYYIESNSSSSVDSSTGIRKGTLRFYTDGTGEVLGKVALEAVNTQVPSGSSFVTLSSRPEISFDVRYPSLTVRPFISEAAARTTGAKDPAAEGIVRVKGKYSRYNTVNNSIVIGDGETVQFWLGCEEKCVDLDLTYKDSGGSSAVSFSKNTGETGCEEKINTALNNKNDKSDVQGPRIGQPVWNTGTHCVTLSHSQDFGSTADTLYNRSSSDVWAVESVNTAVRSTELAGTLCVRYQRADGSYMSYSIKVYCEVRNCLCTY